MDMGLNQHGRIGGVAGHRRNAALRGAARRSRDSPRRRRTACPRHQRFADPPADAAVSDEHHVAGEPAAARRSSAARPADRRAAPAREQAWSAANPGLRGLDRVEQQRVERDRDERSRENKALAFRRQNAQRTPSPARMKENSPICARLADTVSAVLSG